MQLGDDLRLEYARKEDANGRYHLRLTLSKPLGNSVRLDSLRTSSSREETVRKSHILLLYFLQSLRRASETFLRVKH